MSLISQRALTTLRTLSAALFGENVILVLEQCRVCCLVLCQEMNKLKDLSNAGALLFTVRQFFHHWSHENCIEHLKRCNPGSFNSEEYTAARCGFPSSADSLYSCVTLLASAVLDHTSMQFGVFEPLRFAGARGPAQPCFAKGLSNDSQLNAVSLQLVNVSSVLYQGLSRMIDSQGSRMVILSSSGKIASVSGNLGCLLTFVLPSPCCSP